MKSNESGKLSSDSTVTSPSPHQNLGLVAIQSIDDLRSLNGSALLKSILDCRECAEFLKKHLNG